MNVDTGDAYSAIAGAVAKTSYNNSPHLIVNDYTRGNFRGPRSMKFQNLPEGSEFTTVNDGIGTKVVLTDAADTFGLSAYDVVAMCSSDITRYGGKPLVFTNVLDVSTLGKNIHDETFKRAVMLQHGLSRAAKDIDMVVFNGETAELGQCVGSENPNAKLKYNRAGTMQGVYHPEKNILGDKMEAGDIIIALKEDGFRSNGISSVRKAFAKKFGPDWYNNPEAQDYIKQAATPSLLYDNMLTHLNGWDTEGFEKVVDVHGIVHLSGGAFKGKFLDDLLSINNLSARLDNLFEMPEIMLNCAEWRELNDTQIYETWNGGQGMIVVVNPKDVAKTLEEAKKFGIEAKISGEIIPTVGEPSVTIKSARSGEEIIYK